MRFIKILLFLGLNLNLVSLEAGVSEDYIPEKILRVCSGEESGPSLQWPCLQEAESREQLVRPGFNFFVFPKPAIGVTAGQTAYVEFRVNDRVFIREETRISYGHLGLGFVMELPSYEFVGSTDRTTIIARTSEGRLFARILSYPYINGIVIGNVGDGGGEGDENSDAIQSTETLPDDTLPQALPGIIEPSAPADTPALGGGCLIQVQPAHSVYFMGLIFAAMALILQRRKWRAL